jgi:hypothetical protein
VHTYPRKTQEMVFGPTKRVFTVLNATWGRDIYDNMKTAVETAFFGEDRLYNRRFLQMCGHGCVIILAPRPSRPI